MNRQSNVKSKDLWTTIRALARRLMGKRKLTQYIIIVVNMCVCRVVLLYYCNMWNNIRIPVRTSTHAALHVQTMKFDHVFSSLLYREDDDNDDKALLRTLREKNELDRISRRIQRHMTISVLGVCKRKLDKGEGREEAGNKNNKMSVCSSSEWCRVGTRTVYSKVCNTYFLHAFVYANAL